MIDLSNYNVYQNKDGRYRAYNKTTHKVTSYPRILMEAILGRELLPTEDVHHIDENPCNNDPSNLEVIDHREHTRQHGLKQKHKYKNKKMICPICNKSFIWTEKQQSEFYSHTKTGNGPFCSKRCSGIYGTKLQYNNDKNVTPDDLKRICPVCGKEFLTSKASKSRYKNNLNKFKEPVCSSACRFEYKRMIEKKKRLHKKHKADSGSFHNAVYSKGTEKILKISRLLKRACAFESRYGDIAP